MERDNIRILALFSLSFNPVEIIPCLSPSEQSPSTPSAPSKGVPLESNWDHVVHRRQSSIYPGTAKPVKGIPFHLDFGLETFTFTSLTFTWTQSK